MTKISIIVGTVGLIAGAYAENMTVGFRERGKVDVPTGTTVTQSGAVWVSHEGTLDKVGGGEWVLPPASVLSPEPLEVVVRDGSVTVPSEAGTAPALAEPTAILNKAAFWVDATRNVVVSNGADDVDYVLAWKDVRETKSAVPFDYPRAVAKYTVTNVPPQVRQNGAGQDMVYFGEYHSGRWMSFVTPDSENTVKTISNILHSFIVYKAAHSYWYLLGSQGQAQTYHPNLSAANLGEPYTAFNTATSRQALGVRGYLNGKAVDLTEERVLAGCKLLEHDFRGLPGEADDFANGNYANRQGGEDLCEVVLFTNRLTEVERIQVEAWLMRKWHLEGGSANLSFAVARGASVNVDDGKSPIVSGEGRVVKRGEMTATFPDLGDAPTFTGTLAIESGTMVMRDDVAVEAAAGQRIHAGRVADGDHLSYFSDAGNGTFAKSGAGSVLLESVPDDVKRIDVQSGVLTLAAPVNATTVAAGSADAAIQDGSFEMYTGTGFTAAQGTPATNCGWTYGRMEGDTTDSYALIWNAIRGDNAWGLPRITADGECVMIFRRNSFAYTEVTIPQDGTYELSFAVSRRANGYPYLDVYFGPDGNSLTLVTRVACLDENVYTYQSVTLPDVKAGTYRLECRPATNGNLSPLLDDVKVRLVSRPSAAFLIPNGGFEVIDTLPVAYATFANTVNKDNVARGWSLTPSPRLGLALSGVTNKNGVAFQRTGDLREGRVQLFMVSTGTVAVATFKPTRTGTFRLQADIGRWTYAANNAYDGIEVAGTPNIHAAIKIGGADEVRLGGLSRVYQQMETKTWPTAFTIADTNATVTLTVSNSIWNAAAMLDNFAFLPYETSEENLIVDGGFETNGTWTLASPERDVNVYAYSACACSIRSYTDNPQFYGYDIYEGARRLHMTDRAFATQQVTFPTAGRYRLRFHSTERADSRYTPENKGLCPYRAWIARDGVTNVIGRSTSSTSNFVAHTWRFTVPDVSAPWTFGFEAVNEVSSSNRDRAVLIDGVSIVKEGLNLAETPDLPEKLDIAVAAGAQLRLEFTGTNRIDRLTLGGVPVSGIVSAQTYPAYITGDGAFEILPKGTMMIIR